ncbi:MAG: DUF4145 domain-containing protein [Candidatus Omnitrophota bacterium]
MNSEVLCDHASSDADWIRSLYSFTICPKCKEALLVVQEDYGKGWDAPLRVYPPQDKRINPNLPESIKDSFKEARLCFNSKAYTAAVIMCRKTLEGICNVHKIKENNLSDSLQKMKEAGIIEKNLFEWAEALRISGNEAAHDVSVVISAQDASDILEFTDAIIEYVFTFKDKFSEFLDRRKKLKEKPNAEVKK